MSGKCSCAYVTAKPAKKCDVNIYKTDNANRFLSNLGLRLEMYESSSESESETPVEGEDPDDEQDKCSKLPYEEGLNCCTFWSCELFSSRKLYNRKQSLLKSPRG